MALQKEAVLNLKVHGFAEAEQAAMGIAKGFGVAEKYGAMLEAQARGVNAPLSTTAQALEVIQSDAARAVAQFKLMESELGRVAARAALAAGASRGVGPSGARVLPGPGSAASGSAGGAVAVAGLSELVGPAIAVAGALYTAKSAGEALFETIARGEAAATTAESFEKLSASVGGSASTLAALRVATGGVVTDQNLMLASNRLLVGDLDLSQERMAKLTGAAVVLSNAMGTSATSAVLDLAEGLRKQNPRLLQSLGLTTKMDDALKEYAKTHHVAAEAIDEHQKKLIFTEVVQNAAAEASAKLGKTAAELANPTELISVKWANFTTQLDLLVSKQPGFAEALKATADAAIAIGTALTPLIQLAGEVASKLAPVIKMMGEATAFFAGSGAGLQSLGAAVSAGGPSVLGTTLSALGTAQSAAGAGGYKGMGAPASKVEVNITAGATQEALDKTRAALDRVAREQGAANGFGG